MSSPDNLKIYTGTDEKPDEKPSEKQVTNNSENNNHIREKYLRKFNNQLLSILQLMEDITIKQRIYSCFFRNLHFFAIVLRLK